MFITIPKKPKFRRRRSHAQRVAQGEKAGTTSSPRIQQNQSSPLQLQSQPQSHFNSGPAISLTTLTSNLPNSPLQNLQLTPQHAFPLYVSTADLRNATDNGLPKLHSRLFARFRKEVLVESAPFSCSDSLFFAPLRDASATVSMSGPVPTEFAAVPPNVDTDHLVCARHDFEVSFVGMHVTPQDGPLTVSNELLLYSVARRVEGSEGVDVNSGDHEILKRQRRTPRRSSELSISESSEYDHTPSIRSIWADIHSDRRNNRRVTEHKRKGSHESNAHLNVRDDPTMHYDPVQDGHDDGTAPNTFRAIPGRKSLLIRHAGASENASGLANVAMRFTVMEVDRVTEAQRKGVEKLSGVLNNTARGVPFGALISPAVDGLSAAGNAGLDSYAKPDHVISKDVEFKLLQEMPVGEPVNKSSLEGQKDPSSRYAENYLRVSLKMALFNGYVMHILYNEY